MRRLLPLLLLSAPLFGTDYLSAEEAARSMFPQADRIEPAAFTAPGFRGRLLVARRGATATAWARARASRSGTRRMGVVVGFKSGSTARVR